MIYWNGEVEWRLETWKQGLETGQSLEHQGRNHITNGGSGMFFRNTMQRGAESHIH